jgi:hypothetical protein
MPHHPLATFQAIYDLNGILFNAHYMLFWWPHQQITGARHVLNYAQATVNLD